MDIFIINMALEPRLTGSNLNTLFPANRFDSADSFISLSGNPKSSL